MICHFAVTRWSAARSRPATHSRGHRSGGIKQGGREQTIVLHPCAPISPEHASVRRTSAAPISSRSSARERSARRRSRGPSTSAAQSPQMPSGPPSSSYQLSRPLPLLHRTSARQKISAAGVSIRSLLFAAVVFATGHALAQAYPVKPVRVIDGFAPGGSSDIVARVMAPKFQESQQQPLIVENRAGAQGIIGADAVAKATPDGYTLFVMTGTHTVHPVIYRNMRYEFPGRSHRSR